MPHFRPDLVLTGSDGSSQLAGRAGAACRYLSRCWEQAKLSDGLQQLGERSSDLPTLPSPFLYIIFLFIYLFCFLRQVSGLGVISLEICSVGW